jgi:hypothetical protein
MQHAANFEGPPENQLSELSKKLVLFQTSLQTCQELSSDHF